MSIALAHASDFVVLMSPWSPATRSVVETRQAVLMEPAAPLCDARGAHAETHSDGLVGLTVCGAQDHLRSPDQSVGQCARGRERSELRVLGLTERELEGAGSSGTHAGSREGYTWNQGKNNA